MPETDVDKGTVRGNMHDLPGPEDSSAEQVRRWIEAPIAFWEECARLYGPIVRLNLGSLGAVFLLSDPETIRAAFQLPSDAFDCRQFNEHYRYVMGENSVLLQDGERHRSRRRLLSPVLRREPFVPKVAAIREIALCAAAKWPVGELFSPKPSLQEITFQVMVQLLLGNLESEAGQALIAAYRDSVLRQVGSWGPWRNFARLQPQIRALLAGEIQARRADPDRPGALTAFAQARAEDGQPITDAEWEDHVFSLLVAGVDTTALSLTWALYWLSREEGARAKMLEAIEGTPETGNTDLLEQPYLSAFFSEVLRMIPIVTTPSGRRLTRCVQIGPHRFPAGVTLVPCTYLVHRREDLYPDSGRFRPERFLERQYAAWEFFPFGGGARACLGGTLAEIEFKTVLTTILSRWEIHAKEAPPLPPVRHGTLLAPPEPFQVVARPMAATRKGAWA